MKGELRNDSGEGTVLLEFTLGQKIFSIALVCIVTGVLAVLPNIL
jgi:hypothetical protein